MANQQLSSKVQRLFRKEVHPSGWKRGMPFAGQRYSLNVGGKHQAAFGRVERNDLYGR